MGVQVEFNPDLALRNIKEFHAGKREKEECIPEPLERKEYDFLKRGQRLYWLMGELPLVETDGSKLSRPKASVIILEAKHMLIDGVPWTKGRYKVVEVFSGEGVHFDGFSRV